jgi:hypothetical protein
MSMMTRSVKAIRKELASAAGRKAKVGKGAGASGFQESRAPRRGTAAEARYFRRLLRRRRAQRLLCTPGSGGATVEGGAGRRTELP